MNSDTDRIDKLESLLADKREKLNITKDGYFLADIYDLREWIDSMTAAKRVNRKADPEATKRRSDAAKARWTERKNAMENAS